MRIAFLNPSGGLGGAEIALLDVLAALRDARPSWTLKLVASAEGALVERAAALNVEASALTFPESVARLGEWGRRGSFAARAGLAAAVGVAAVPAVRYAARLSRQLDEFKPDIVHSNGLKMHLLGARCRPASSKLLWHLHDYPDSRPVTARLLRAHAPRCAGMVANSISVAEHARALFGAAIPVQALYNSVDFNRFSPNGPTLDLDALSGLPPLEAGGVRIGLLGTFARWKGHGVFLEALSALQSSRVRGYIIGGPIYETAASQYSLEELRAAARAAGVERTVGFTGQVSDVPAALRSLDIVVHASTEPEPFGLVIAEAMACGRAMVVSNAGGAAEIAKAGALLHQPGNAGQLADRVAQLVADASLREKLGDAGRAMALELFSRRRLVDTLVPLYESLVPAHAH